MGTDFEGRRGYRFCGVPTTPIGMDIFLLGLFFGYEPFDG